MKIIRRRPTRREIRQAIQMLDFALAAQAAAPPSISERAGVPVEWIFWSDRANMTAGQLDDDSGVLFEECLWIGQSDAVVDEWSEG